MPGWRIEPMQHNQVVFWAEPETFQIQETLYLEVRRKEGRVLSDTSVLALPNVSDNYPYAREWRWRSRSFERLQQYFHKRFLGQTQILDLGCGNGWMANQLANNPLYTVTAMDLNREELSQGARLFGRGNLRFVYGTVPFPALVTDTFDLIVLAASVQYFPDLPTLVQELRKRLNPGGEIHFVDSHFYPNLEAHTAAQARTRIYYTQAGVPDMAAFYHHHLMSEAVNLGAENLNSSLIVKLLQKSRWLAPFPWLRLKP